MGHTTSDFLGTDRFRIRRRLGSGGMGVVYEAHDRETNKVVALKALTRTEASHISRFKNEFRSLADVAHPNLVSLYEFMSDGQYWFFTMELVQGVNFLEYVRPGYRARRRSQDSISPTLLKTSKAGSNGALVNFEAETQQLDLDRLTTPDEPLPETEADAPVDFSQLDPGRLEAALSQLADGLQALHQTGKLHRDIKPSNVLVNKEGRVVILDFGLVAEVEGVGQHESITLAGTPDYMSPEQGAQLPISAASDWYSVGVILYQSLTGRLPFSGKFFDVMMNKQSFDPPAPCELVPDLPPMLNDLCMKLLRRNPSKRPSGREVMRILGHGKSGPLRTPLTPAGALTITEGATFVGRESHLQELTRAFQASRRGQPVTMYIPGTSGIGKSALVRHFLEDLQQRNDQVVILEGRCYERESVPYKAIDGVVDSLTRFLLSVPEARAEALMPRDVHALARLFPVMLQVDSVFNAPQRELDIPDPFTLRRRAFVALREMLARISDRQPLVIWIDDLQWSDADSTILLEELLRPPDAPPLLLLASFRSEDIETKPFLETLLEETGSDTCRQLPVTPLSKDEAATLVSRLVPVNVTVTQVFIDSIVREARGSPFLLEQLTSYASTAEDSSTSGTSLAVMLDARLRHLPKGARQFIDVLAVAGRPINQEVAFQAAGLSGDELPLVSSLRAAQFLRSGGLEHSVELYHDRIRETLASQLDQMSIKQIHRRLAQALESRGIDDPESLFEHYLGAGERVRASSHAAVAARKASATLAFDRASVFYRRALEFAPGRGADLIEMKRGLADALANAGRPAEAAETYLELARDTSTSRSLYFQRRAAEQLLMGGHIDEGLRVLRAVLSALGFSLPGGPKRALFSLTLRRLQIRLRGLDFVEREESTVSESSLFRIDTCWAAAAGLGMVDLIRGADFQSRHLLLALRTGEPYRVARALAFEAAQTASRGARARERASHIAQKAELLAQKVGNPHAIGLAIWARGLSSYLVGDWKNAAELCERAAEVLRNECTGVTWESTIAHRFMLSALLYLGEVAEVSRRVPHLLSMAVEQGNLFAATDLRTRLNLIWLAADNPNLAREEVIAAMKAWPQEGFHLQHYSSLVALAQIELYTGDFEVVWKHIEGQLGPLEESMLLRIQILRVEARHLRARAALASATGRERQQRLQIADNLARKIQKEPLQWAEPLAALIRAGAASVRKDKSTALTFLSRALEGFSLAHMALYEAASRRRLGEAVGGERGRQLIIEADDWMTRQRIQNPARMTQMLAPGFDSTAAD
jgi:serine/threonine protein kinase/tetratricopeptide (TPR) repeat protein